MKKFFALLVSLCMILSFCIVPAAASDVEPLEGEIEVVETQEDEAPPSSDPTPSEEDIAPPAADEEGEGESLPEEIPPEEEEVPPSKVLPTDLPTLIAIDEDGFIDLQGEKYVIDDTIQIDDAIYLSNGTITRSSNTTIFDVYGDLTLDNITLQGESESNYNDKSPVVIEQGGQVVMAASAITDFIARRGGGVHVIGTLILESGSAIDNNAVWAHDRYRDQEAAVGGGIYIDNGGLVEMYDGSSVSDNKADSDDHYDQIAIGGGIAIMEGGSFTMYGGTISGNSVGGCSATSEGGGICIGSDSYDNFKGLGSPDGDSIHLYGGTISNNYAKRGGGIYIHAYTTIHLENVKITDNHGAASSGGFNPWGPPPFYGGGIGFCPNGRAEMHDGSGALITGNTATYGYDFGAANASWLSTFDYAPDGSEYTWYQDCQYGDYTYNGEPITDFGAWFSAFIAWSYGGETLGLRSSVSDRAYDYDYKLEITGNTCDEFGAGIACNGTIVFGNGDIIPEPETTEITVTKVWQNYTGSEVAAPANASIEVKLLDNGEEIDSVTLSNETGWSYTFSDLAIDGKYSVEESNYPSGFESTIVDNNDGTFTIINREAPPPYTPPEEPETPPPEEPETPPEEPEEPDVEIPDEPPPLEDIPDEGPPLSDIPDDDVPLVDIPDDDVPMTDIPQTGDISGIWGIISLFSGGGLVGLLVTDDKNKKNPCNK